MASKATLTLDEAEALFKRYLGQFFHVFREEGSEICQAYDDFNIKREVEISWIHDVIKEKDEKLKTLNQGNNRQEFFNTGEDMSWVLLTHLIDMGRNYPEAWPNMLPLFIEHDDKITDKGLIIVAENLLGYSHPAYGRGPVFQAYHAGDYDLARLFRELAKFYLSNAKPDKAIRKRYKSAKRLWRMVKRRTDPNINFLSRYCLDWIDARTLNKR